MPATVAQHLELRDRHGRVARDLRLSLTDRCNLRCTYCMPAEGLPWLPTADTLTDAEVVRLARIAVGTLGVDQVRFTGGEPLLRRSLEDIVGAVAALRTPGGTRPEISLTTNGLGLAHRAAALRGAGLDRVNISLDAVERERYAQIARRDRLPDVIAGIDAATAAGLTPVKLNTVLMRGVNEDQAVPLLAFALERGHQLRFIEQMPLGPTGEWQRTDMVTASEILAELGTRFELAALDEPRGSAPAELWGVAADDTQPGGRLGVIASVTNPFCGACDRTRLTSDGQVRTCLFSQRETDLRAILRRGGTDEDIVEAWTGAHRGKAKAHGINEAGFIQPARTMSAIGG